MSEATPTPQDVATQVCDDCGRVYQFSPILTREQWLMVAPSGYGMLCGYCVGERAARLPHALWMETRLVFSHDAALDATGDDRATLTAEVAALRARVAELETPTLFWSKDDPEVGCGDLYELAEYRDWYLPGVHELSVARTMPNRWLAILPDPEDEDCLIYRAFATEAEARAAYDAALATPARPTYTPEGA